MFAPPDSAASLTGSLQALSQTASAAAAGSDTSVIPMRSVAASVTVTAVPTDTPAASTARSPKRRSISVV